MLGGDADKPISLSSCVPSIYSLVDKPGDFPNGEGKFQILGIRVWPAVQSFELRWFLDPIS